MDYQNEYTSNNDRSNSGFVRRNANTYSYTFFNKDKMLSMSFYNDFLSISIADKFVGEDGETHYTPKDKRATKLLSRENAITLLSALDNDLVPEMAAYNNDSTANFDSKAILDLSRGVINTGREEVSLIDIHAVMTPGTDAKLELRLHFGIDSNRIARESKVYEFATSTYIENYDAATGNCSVKEYYSQFMLFKKLLEMFVDAGSHAVSHDIQQSLGWMIDRTNNTINAIAEKNGITTGKRYNNTYQADSPFKEAYRTDQAPTEAITMKETDSITDLMGSSDSDIPF